MDIIIIGKASYNRNDKPVLVYCGQSRDEAQEALRKAAGDGRLVRFYELDPEPHHPVTAPARAEQAGQEKAPPAGGQIAPPDAPIPGQEKKAKK